MRNKLITTALVSTIALTSVVGLGSSAFADDANSSTTGKAPTAQEISAHDAESAEKLEERLTSLVEEGMITSAQKTAITEFFELNKPTSNADANKEEREQAKEEFKTALETFASENGFDADLLKPDKGDRGGRHEKLSQEERATKQEEHLSSLVEQGKITEAQKAAIVQFRTDNKPSTDPKDLSQDERKAQREQMRTAFENFASENGINVDDVKPARGPEGRGGPGGPRGR